MRIKSLVLLMVLLLSFAFPLTPALASSGDGTTQASTSFQNRGQNRGHEWEEVEHRHLQRGFEDIVLANGKGEKIEVVRKVVQQGTSGMVFFWLIQKAEDLKQVLSIPHQAFVRAYGLASQNPNLAKNKGLEILGFHSMPYGGWVWWDSSQAVIYISHGMVTHLLLIFGMGAFVSAIMSIIGGILLPPLGWVPGAVWAALWSVGAVYLAWLDDAGNPGFYIIARNYHISFVP